MITGRDMNASQRNVFLMREQPPSSSETAKGSAVLRFNRTILINSRFLRAGLIEVPFHILELIKQENTYTSILSMKIFCQIIH
jgi:hypothetical protein